MARGKVRGVGNPAARPATISRIVDECLRSRSRGKWPVSLAGTVSAVRLRSPETDLTDRELADLIAIRALEIGCDVTFDADLLNEERQKPA